MNLPHSHDIGPRGAQPKEQFHFVEPSARLERDDTTLTKHNADGSQEAIPLPSQAISQPPVGPGWVEYGSWTNDTGQKITSFTGKWQVPAPPAVQAGQVIFLSMGLQTSASGTSDLFLPVLQWGPSAAGGGQYWSVSCWYQHMGRVTYSKLLRVETGDTVFGSVARTVDNKFGTEWVGSAKVEGSISRTTSVPVIGEIELGWAFVALEAYSPDIACNQFPATGETLFQELALESETTSLTPAWKGTVEFQECNNKVEVISPSEVRLIYL